jgi:hypothetical protein
MERKTIIWSAVIAAVVIALIIIFQPANFGRMNAALNYAFGPEPSIACTQDSDCTYAATQCGRVCVREIVNKDYTRPFCPLPQLAPDILCKPVYEQPLACVQGQCVVKP